VGLRDNVQRLRAGITQRLQGREQSLPQPLSQPEGKRTDDAIWRGVEQLEPRLLLSATVQIDEDGAAAFRGDETADTVVLRANLDNGNLEYSFDGIDFSQDLDPLTVGEQTMQADKAKVEVDLGAGEDVLQILGTKDGDRFEIDGNVAKLGKTKAADSAHAKTSKTSKLKGLKQVEGLEGLKVTHRNVEKIAFQGRAGDDVIEIAAPTTAAVEVDAGTGDDTLIGDDVDSTWRLTGTNEGTVESAVGPAATTGSAAPAEAAPKVAEVAFAEVENLLGGTGSDDFVFEDEAAITGVIDGSGGTNTLDYSAYTTDVTVDLIVGANDDAGSGTATGTGGVANIHHVIFGQGTGNSLTVHHAQTPQKAIDLGAQVPGSTVAAALTMSGSGDAAWVDQTPGRSILLAQNERADVVETTEIQRLPALEVTVIRTAPSDHADGEEAWFNVVLAARGPPAGHHTNAPHATEIGPADLGAIVASSSDDTGSGLESLFTEMNLALAAVALTGRVRTERTKQGKANGASANGPNETSGAEAGNRGTIDQTVAVTKTHALHQTTRGPPAFSLMLVGLEGIAVDLSDLPAMTAELMTTVDQAVAASTDQFPTDTTSALTSLRAAFAFANTDLGQASPRGPPSAATRHDLSLADPSGSSDAPLPGTTPTDTKNLTSNRGPAAGDAGTVSGHHLAPIVSEAIRRWAAASSDPDVTATLAEATVRIRELGNGIIARTDGTVIEIDIDAAGHGWFIDATPGESTEFVLAADGVLTARPDGPADGRLDLLSVVTHELGHILGLSHADATPESVMAASLVEGVRRIPSMHVAPATPVRVDRGHAAWQHLLEPLPDLSGESNPLTITFTAIGEVIVVGSDSSDGTYAIVDPVVGGLNSDTFVFQNGAVAAALIDGGPGQDTLDFSQYATSVTVTLSTLGSTDGLAGDTTGTPNPITGGFDNFNAIIGGSVSDTLVGRDAVAMWTVDGSGNEYENVNTNPLAFAGFETLSGGSSVDSFFLSGALTHDLGGGDGTDAFLFDAGAVLTGTIDGQGNGAALNFSAFTTGVDVALSAVAAASGFNGTVAAVTGGFSNVGSLLGGTGADTLTGLDGVASWALGLTPEYVSGAGSLDFGGFDSLIGGALADTFDVADGFATGIDVSGGLGSDFLNGPDIASEWSFGGVDAGLLNDLPFGLIENVTGGNVEDVFDFGRDGGVSGLLSDLGGTVHLDVAGFARLSGTFTFAVTNPASVFVTDGTTSEELTDATIVTISATNGSVFVGTDGNGFQADVSELAVAIVTSGTRSWHAVEGTITNASLTGLEGITADPTSLAVEINARAADDTFVDFTTLAGGGLTVGAIFLDFDLAIVKAEGALTGIDIFGFVSGSATGVFLRQTADVDVDDDGSFNVGEGDLENADLLGLELTVSNLFAGVPGEAGFSLTAGTLAVARIAATAPGDDRSFLAMASTVTGGSFSGIPGVDATVQSLMVQLNRATDAEPLDWADALDLDGDGTFGDELTIGSQVIDFSAAKPLAVSGSLTGIDIFGLVTGDAGFDFRRQLVDVDLNDDFAIDDTNDLDDAELVTLELTVADLFVGVAGEAGFSLDAGALALARITGSNPDGTHVYQALASTVTAGTFTGIPEISATVDSLSVMLNEASGTANPFPINWRTQVDNDADEPLFAPVGPDGLIIGGTTIDFEVTLVTDNNVVIDVLGIDLAVSGTITGINLLGIVTGSASFHFERGTIDVDTSGNGSPDLTAADFITLAVDVTDLFVGVPGGAGFELDAGSLALARITSGAEAYLAIAADVTGGSFVGIPDVSGTIESLSVNLNAAANGDTPLDWTSALDLDGGGFGGPGDQLVVGGVPIDFTVATELSATGLVTGIDLLGLVSGSAAFELRTQTDRRQPADARDRRKRPDRRPARRPRHRTRGRLARARPDRVDDGRQEVPRPQGVGHRRHADGHPRRLRDDRVAVGEPEHGNRRGRDGARLDDRPRPEPDRRLRTGSRGSARRRRHGHRLHRGPDAQRQRRHHGHRALRHRVRQRHVRSRHADHRRRPLRSGGRGRQPDASRRRDRRRGRRSRRRRAADHRVRRDRPLRRRRGKRRLLPDDRRPRARHRAGGPRDRSRRRSRLHRPDLDARSRHALRSPERPRDHDQQPRRRSQPGRQRRGARLDDADRSRSHRRIHCGRHRRRPGRHPEHRVHAGDRGDQRRSHARRLRLRHGHRHVRVHAP